MKRMLSVRPEWVAKILNGEKTIEVRKHALKEGDEVHIYVTKQKPFLYRLMQEAKQWFIDKLIPDGWLVEKDSHFNGKVVAKFIVGKVEEIKITENDNLYTDLLGIHKLLENSCLSRDQLFNYFVSSRFGAFAHAITNLEIFDKPKSLKEFGLKKAPQSWCYVKEGE